MSKKPQWKKTRKPDRFACEGVCWECGTPSWSWTNGNGDALSSPLYVVKKIRERKRSKKP